MSGRIVPTILGMGQRFTGIGPLPIFLVFDGRPWNCHAPVDVSLLKPHFPGNRLTQKDNADSEVQFITPAGPRQSLLLAKDPVQHL